MVSPVIPVSGYSLLFPDGLPVSETNTSRRYAVTVTQRTLKTIPRNSSLHEKYLTVPPGSTFIQQGPKLVDLSVSGTDFQGWSVGISTDGNTAVVGGYGVNSQTGSGWIYTRSNSTWTKAASLVGSNSVGPAQQGDAVAISADGLTAAVGGYNDNGGIGAVWIYKNTNGVWSQQGAKLVASDGTGTSWQGSSVSLSADGNTLLVGGAYDNSHQGAAWVYTRSGNVWSQQGSKLIGSGAVGADVYQGYSVCLSADGNTALSGGYGDASNTGAVWEFVRSGSSWSQVGAKLTASDESGNGEFGYSVSMSANASTVVIGAMLDNTTIGAAWIFTGSTAGYSQSGTKLVGTGIGSSSPGICKQGGAVSISSDGSTVAVGGWGDQNYAGAVWIYTGSGGVWTQSGQKVTSPGTSNLGKSLALSGDGMTFIAGEPNDISNSIYYGASMVFAVPYTTPSLQATNLIFTAATTVSATASWKNGNGTARLLFMYQGASPSPATPVPVTGTAYTAGANFTAGTQIGTTGWYCVYNGTGSSVNITGLSSGTTYQLMTQEYNGMAGNQVYNTATATGNPATFITPAPTIAYSGSLSNETTQYGIAYWPSPKGYSNLDQFTVSGNTLSAGITVTAPTGYEVSTSSTSGFASTLLIGAAGTVVSTTVYIRLTAQTNASATPYTGNVTLTSLGSPTNAGPAISGTVSPAPFSLVLIRGFYKSYGQVLGVTQVSGSVPTGLNGDYITGLTATPDSAGSSPTASAGTTYLVAPSNPIGNASFLVSNYSIIYYAYQAQVAPATLVITANNTTRVYGSVLTANPVSQAFTAATLQNGETIGSVAINYPTGNNATDGVGTYSSSPTPSGATGGNFKASNYNVYYQSGNMTVTQAPLSIQSGLAKSYGVVLNGGPGFTLFTAKGLLNGDLVGSVTVQYGQGAAGTDGVGNYQTVTSSGATGSTFNAANYAITYPEGYIYVLPKTISVTATTFNKFYGTTLTDGPGYANFSASGLQNGESIGSVNLAFGSGRGATDIPGLYTASSTPSAASGGTFNTGNYFINYFTGPVQVDKEPLTITPSTVSKAYGTVLGPETAQNGFTAVGLVNGQTVGTVTLAFSSGSAQTDAAATYTNSVTARQLAGGNFLAAYYQISYNQADLIVTASNLIISITADATTKPYGLALSGGSGYQSFTAKGLLNGDQVGSVSISYGAGAAASAPVAVYPGSVTGSAATGSGFNPANYTINYQVSDLAVTTSALVITANNVSKVYGTSLTGVTGSAAFTSTPLQNNETLNGVNINYTAGAAISSAAGSYSGSVIPSSVTGGATFSASNYTIVYTSGDLTVTGTPLTITAKEADKTYGMTLESAPGQTAFSSSGLINGDVISSVSLSYGTGAAASAATGSYASSVTPGLPTGPAFNPANYLITYGNGNIVISPALLVIAVTPASKVFGTGLTRRLGATGPGFFTYPVMPNSEFVSTADIVYGTGSATTDPAGTYPGGVTASNASGSGFTASNYQISYVNASLTVTPAPLAIIAQNISKTYGSTLVNSASQTTFTTTALANSDAINNVSLAYGAGAGALDAAGSYPGSVIPSLPLGNSSFNPANYAIFFIDGAISVGQAPLDISVNTVTKTYGTQLSGASASGIFSPIGLVNGDMIDQITQTLGMAGSKGASVGAYINQVVPSDAIGSHFRAGNYAITYHPASINVVPAALVITANAETKVYGPSSLPVSSGTVLSAGLLAGETIATVTLTYGAGSAGTDPVNTYAGSVTAAGATGGSFSPGNYTITYLPASLTVTPAALAITTGPITKVYGTQLMSSSGIRVFTSTPLQNNETIASVTTMYGNGAASTSPVGNYLAQAVSSQATGGSFLQANYKITYNTADITVTQASLSIIATGPSKVYGTALTATSGTGNFTTTALMNNESVSNVLLTPDPAGAAANTAAGVNYTVMPSAATGKGTFLAANYQLTYIPFTGTVSPLLLSITATAPGKVYGDQLPATSATTSFSATPMAKGESIMSVTLNRDAAGQSSTTLAGKPYTVTPSNAVGSAQFMASNYTVTYVPLTSNVMPAPLTIMAAPVSKVYGVTLTSGVGSASFTSSGLQNSDHLTAVSVNYTAGAVVGSPVGGYPGAVVINRVSGDVFIPANYTISYLPALLTVTPANLVISAVTQQKTYGTALSAGPGFTAFTSQGFQNNEVAGSVTFSPGSGALATDRVGTYPGSAIISGATGGTFTPANYTISYQPAAIVINKTALAVLALDVTKKYGFLITGSVSSQAFTSSGLQNGETIATVTTVYGPGAASSAQVGVYTGSTVASLATGSFNPGNYSISYFSGNIIVDASALIVKPLTAHKLYGNSLTAVKGSVAFTVTGLQNSETATLLNLSYGTGASPTATAGTYPGSVTGSSLAGGNFISTNYLISYIAADLVVGTQTPVVIVLSQPNCGTALGIFTIQNYDAASIYTLSAPGFTSQAGAVFTAPPGTYSITALAPASFTSLASTPFIITPQPPVPNLIITNPLEVNAPTVVNLESPAITALSDPNLILSYYSDINGQISLPNPTVIVVSGVYYIKGTNSSGCSSPVKAVFVYIEPAPRLIITNPATVSDPTTVDLTASGVTAGSTPGLIYTYFTDSAGTIPLTDPATVSIPGIYYIRGTNTGGSSLIRAVKVTITYTIFIPNVFSPNGDGKNDRFVIVRLQHFPGSSLKVFNRWGNQVYASANYDNTWDGGGQVPGTYYYVLILKDGTETTYYKGWVQILH